MSVSIKVPDHVFVQLEGMPEPQKFEFVRHFLGQVILADKQFGEDHNCIIAAYEIRSAFKGASPGSTVDISHAHWEKLVKVAKNPSAPYNPAVMMDAISFLHAVLTPEAIDGKSER